MTADCDKQDVRRINRYQTTDRELGGAAEQKNKSRNRPNQRKRNVRGELLVHDFRDRHGDDVEHEPAGERNHRECPEHRRCDIERKRHLSALGRTRLFVAAFARHQKIRDADCSAHDRRKNERCAPASGYGDRGSDTRRERHAEISEHAVRGEIAPAIARVGNQHRNADGMIDRRENTKREQSDGKPEHVRRRGGGRERYRAAEEENRHKLAAAPVVADPAPWQRETVRRQQSRRSKAR